MSVSGASQDREFYDAGDPELNIVRDTGTGEMYRKRPKEGGTHGRTSSLSIQRRDGAHWCRPRKGKKRTRSPKDRPTSSVIDPDGTETSQPAETVDVATVPIVVRDGSDAGGGIDEQRIHRLKTDVIVGTDESIDDRGAKVAGEAVGEVVGEERDSEGDDEAETDEEENEKGDGVPDELDDEGSNHGRKEPGVQSGVEERTGILATPHCE